LYKNNFSSFVLLSIAFLQLIVSINSYASSYLGSYLFCSNENGLRGDSYWDGKVDWKWSKGNILNSNYQMNDKYKNFTYLNESGTWINGFGGISANNYKFFLLVRKTFENKDEAIQYCQTLEQKCVNEFGPSYKYVGVSSWSIPISAWGTIAVLYKEDKGTKWTTCSNWKYSDYKELNYYPVWKVAGSAAFAAAELVIYSMTFIYAGILFILY
jgi:hypothetical protein